MSRKLSSRQIETMMAATRLYPGWFRARSNGERVTLASLSRHGFLECRLRRAGKNSADNAYEYRPTADFMAAARKDGLA